MVKIEQKSYDEATPAELRQFAARFLGIPVSDAMSDADVEAKVRAAHEGDLIFVTVDEPVDQTGAPPPAVRDESTPDQPALVGGLGRNDPKVTLTLHAEERDGVVVTRHKEIGVNGVVWLIKRGVPVDVPYRVFEALNNAVRDNITHDDEGNVISQTVHSVPFSVEKMPPAEEIAAWHKRTSSQFCPA